MRQAFLYRLYVNETQSDKLDNLLCLARHLYNSALQQRHDAIIVNTANTIAVTPTSGTAAGPLTLSANTWLFSITLR